MRWILIASLVYAACVAYACFLGAVVSVLAPEFPAGWRSWFRAGSYAGLVFAPVMGFFVLRALNLSVSVPEDEERWWPRAHRLVFQAFGIIALFGVAGALVGALVSRNEAASGLALGSLWGLVMTAAPRSS